MTEGYTIEQHFRWLTHREGRRSLRIGCEPLVDPPALAIYLSEIGEWQTGFRPDDPDRRISAGKRAEIAANVRTWASSRPGLGRVEYA